MIGRGGALLSPVGRHACAELPDTTKPRRDVRGFVFHQQRIPSFASAPPVGWSSYSFGASRQQPPLDRSRAVPTDSDRTGRVDGVREYVGPGAHTADVAHHDVTPAGGPGPAHGVEVGAVRRR